MAAEVRIRSFSSTDEDYTTAFLQTTTSDHCTQGSSHCHVPYVNEEDLSSEEDDVFIRDPIKGHHGNNNAAAKKPLMHPRHRPRAVSRVRWTCQRLMWSAIYLLIIVMALAAFVCMIIYIVNVYAVQVLTKTAAYQAAIDRLNSTEKTSPTKKTGWAERGKDDNIIPCTQISVEDVWVNPLPKLLTESSIRLLDINGDGVLDAVFGFATGADKHQKIPAVVCNMYFNGSYPCSGGLIALDGGTGREIWRHYAQHEMFAVTCNADLDGDGLNDCLGAGRAGTFQAVSSKTGRLLWDFQDSKSRNKDMNLYTAQFIADVDEDGVSDILQVHGGDPLGEPGSETRLAGKVMIFSGKDGRPLQDMFVPDNKESYFSPVIYSRKDGTKVVLFGTGGETHPGALWVVTLHDLIKGQINKAERIYWDHFKGVMTPPVLIDLTGDGTRDIVIAPFNSTLIAIDGENYKTLWNFSYGLSETYCTPSPGYYNDDDVPDFMVKFAHGPGYPIYYHAVTTVIDGRTGKPLLNPYIKETVGGQTSPLTISVEGHGNDLFLYWIADCLQNEGRGGQFAFVEGTNVHEQSRSDFCRLRFKSRGFTQMMAINQHQQTPGVALYYSEDRKKLEHSAWVNTTAEALQYLRKHPEYYADYRAYTQQSQRIEQERPENMYKDLENSRLKSKLHTSIFDTDGLPYTDNVDRISKKGQDPQQLLKNINNVYSDQGYQNYHTNRDNYGENYRSNEKLTEKAPEFDYLQSLLQKDNVDGLSGQVSDKFTDLVNSNLLGKQNDYLTKRTKKGKMDASLNKRVLHPKIRQDKMKNKWKKVRIYDESLQVVPDDLNDRGKSAYVSSKHNGGNLHAVEKSLSSSIEKLRNQVQIKPNKKHSLMSPRKKRRSTTEKHSTSKSKRATQSRGHFDKRQSQTVYNNEKQTRVKSRMRDSFFKQLFGSKYLSAAGEEVHLSVGDFLEKERRRLEASSKTRFSRSRTKRHVGPHDSDGLQRLISTGTLAPPTLPPTHPDYHHSMDIIFAVYWFYPAKTQSVLPEDQKCIDSLIAKEKIRFSPSSKYYGMDHDAYKHAVTHECLEKSDHQMAHDGLYESQISYNPYNVHMGQMTVYRLRIKCTCDKEAANRNSSCSRILPFEQQEWPAYMGRHGDSHWQPRN